VSSAGELCIELGILPWPEGEATDACRKFFMAWIELRGGIGNHEAEQAVATVRRFIELHGESRFTMWVKNGYVEDTNDLDARIKTISRVGFRCVTGDGRYEYYILPKASNSEICRGQNPTGVTKELVKRGYLHTGPTTISL
jgi:putative DNA primase/helicase